MLLSASASLLLTACDKEVVTQLDTISPQGQANVKVVYASAYTTNSSVQLKVNGTRVSNLVTNATPYPGGGLNTGGASSPWYMALTPGQEIISVAIPKSGTNLDSVSLYNGAIYTSPDKFYSAYLTDTLNKTQLVLVNDNLALPNFNTSRYKFVNLMPNQMALDLYFGANKVASNVAYTTTSPEFTMVKGDTARWYVRPAGAAPTSAALATYPAIVPTFAAAQTVPQQRVLTVFARGYSGATGNRAPNVSLLYNY